MRRSITGLHRTFQQLRPFATARPLLAGWSTGPSPPRLPKSEQEVYEQLQKQSTGAFSTPRSPPKINQVAGSGVETAKAAEEIVLSAKVKDGEELHPNIRRGAAPEFEGDINPKTGEVGGPKNEPLRWGHSGDWSYNGRATDF